MRAELWLSGRPFDSSRIPCVTVRSKSVAENIAVVFQRLSSPSTPCDRVAVCQARAIHERERGNAGNSLHVRADFSMHLRNPDPAGSMRRAPGPRLGPKSSRDWWTVAFPQPGREGLQSAIEYLRRALSPRPHACGRGCIERQCRDSRGR